MRRHQRDEKIVEAAKDHNVAIAPIALEYGLTKQRVYQILTERGVNVRQRIEDRRMELYHKVMSTAKTYTPAETAVILGIEERLVLHILKKNKIKIAPAKKESFAGKRYNDWTVLEEPTVCAKTAIVLCRCERCKREVPVHLYNIMHNVSKCCHKCSIKTRKVRPILVDGNKYPSMSAVARCFNISISTIIRALRSGSTSLLGRHTISYADD